MRPHGTAGIFAVVYIATIPLWACSISYSCIALHVARLWPNPNCCCFRTPFSAGDGSVCCCCSLLGSVTALLIVQAVVWLAHICMLIVELAGFRFFDVFSCVAQVRIPSASYSFVCEHHTKFPCQQWHAQRDPC